MIKTNLSALIANGKEDFYKAAGFYESITGLRARNDINVSACSEIIRPEIPLLKKARKKNAVNV